MSNNKTRFKDENGNSYPDWIEKRLGGISTMLKGKGLSKKDISESGSPCLLYGQLYTTYGTIINNPLSTTNTIIEKPVLSKRGDILMPSSGETSDAIVVASVINFDEPAILGGDLNIIRVDQSIINPIFLSYQIRSSLKKAISQVAQGHTVVHLYNSQLQEIKVLVPCIEEQEKIAALFAKLDERIELREQKIANLKDYKKGLQQAVFGINGERTLKFKDAQANDYPDWEEKTLGRVSEFIKDGTHGTHKPSDDGYLLLSAKNIKNGKITIRDDERTLSKEDFHKFYKNWTLSENDVLLTIVGTIGRVAVCKNYYHNVLFQRSVAIIRSQKDFMNPLFLAGWLESQSGQKELSLRTVVSAQPGIYLKSLEEIEIRTPVSIEEQTKIANLFSKLDQQIEKEEALLESYKEQKQGFMQRMF
jgi:type I restriction enzyme S subunit